MSRPLLLVFVAAFASGCGSQASGPAPSADPEAPRLSAAAFTTRANAVCARRQRRIAGLTEPRTEAESRAAFARIVAIERAELSALARLRPPLEKDETFSELLSAHAKLVRAAEELGAIAGRPITHAGRRAIADAEREAEEYDRAARELGLRCRQTV